MVLHRFSLDEDKVEKAELLKRKKEEKERARIKKFVGSRKRDSDFSIDTPEEDVKNEMQRDWEKRTHPRG